MTQKSMIWIGMIVGSTVGGYIPGIFGADIFSFWSIIFSGIGGIAGILIGYKLSR